MSDLRDAWNELCGTRAEPAEPCYVSLYSTVRRYGGPEEGGWWYDDRKLEESVRCPSREAARRLVFNLARRVAERNAEAKRQHGRRCQESMEWLEARGLEADFLPEPDDAEELTVHIEDVPGSRETSGRPEWS